MLCSSARASCSQIRVRSPPRASRSRCGCSRCAGAS